MEAGRKKRKVKGWLCKCPHQICLSLLPLVLLVMTVGVHIGVLGKTGIKGRQREMEVEEKVEILLKEPLASS